MRALHLTRDFPPRSVGGISTAVGGMVSALVACGVDCAVISFDGWRPRRGSTVEAATEESTSGVDVLRVSSPEHLPQAAAFAARFAPSVLHVHHSMLWSFADELRRAAGVPAVLEVHVLQHHQNELRGLADETLSSRSQQQALSGADHIIAPSRAARDILVRGGVDAAAVTTIGFGVDVPPVVPAIQREPLAIYVGRFADINGTAELISVVAGVARAVPVARFVIAGGIPHNPKAERKWLRRFDAAWSAQLRERVDVVGWLEPSQLGSLYARAGVLVSPSWFESFGFVILEAMAYGTPIAATRAGAVPELITHDQSGLLCEPRDVDALVANTVRLLSQPQRAAKLGAAARDAAALRTWSEAGRVRAQLYARLAA